MREFRWQITLGVSLVAASILFYFFHYLIFHDPHHIFIYLVGDVAFVPIEVLMVTLILHRLLSVREKRIMLNKLNMVIGAFFNEIGTELLQLLMGFSLQAKELAGRFEGLGGWKRSDFDDAIQALKRQAYRIDSRKEGLEHMKEFLQTKRTFLLRLLENPNLLEHESFTELLWAVSHLMDELHHRKSLTGLPEPDLDHLAIDMERAGRQLVVEWVAYLRHLKTDYPYLFSLAVRTNPFDPKAQVEIGE